MGCRGIHVETVWGGEGGWDVEQTEGRWGEQGMDYGM